MKVKYLLIVKPDAGLIVRDTPRPEGQGAIRRRAEGRGAQLNAYDIFNFGGVPYALLVPRDPAKPEWIRVAEADGRTVYVEKILLDDESNSSDIAAALHDVADAIRSLKD